MWSYFEATGILKEFGNDDHLKYRLWWYISEDEKYVRIIDDNDIDKIVECIIQNKCEAHIYVEHSITGIIVANVGGGHSNVEGGLSNVSRCVDDSVVDVYGGVDDGGEEVSKELMIVEMMYLVLKLRVVKMKLLV